jgi:hypothetical protein
MKERDLRDILTHLEVPIVHKNHRGWLVARCPFAEFLHERGTDSSPSFNIRIDPSGPSGYYCFTCKQKGSVPSLVNRLAYYRDADYNHIALKAAVLEVPETFPDFEETPESEAPPEPLNPQVYLAMYPLAWEDKEARNYLSRRHIGRQTSEDLSLRYDPERRRILFPVFDYKNDLFGFTGRSIVPDDNRAKDVPKIRNYSGLKKEFRLLGEHLIEPGKPLLVVEGLFALAHMLEIGVAEFANPVAIMGSSLSMTQRDLLVSHDVPVFLLFDDDHPGSIGLYGAWDKTKQAWEGGGAVDILREHTPTFVCLYPERTGDPDNLTYDEVKRMINRDHE